MLPRSPTQAPRTQNTADTLFVLTVSRGLASPRTREFRAGEPQEAASVGTSGDWQLRGPGVEPIHAYLYFDGEQLFVQSALEGRDVVCGGQRVGNDWEPVEVSAVLEIGTARITLSQISQPGASAVARASAVAPAITYEQDEDDLELAGGTLPMAKPAPIVISPKGAAEVTGEERTSFVPLGPPSSRLGDDEEATRFPLLGALVQKGDSARSVDVRAVTLPLDDDDESTRMVSLESKSAAADYGETDPLGHQVEDPYDDLQERTHASTGASAVSSGLATAARAALDARGMVHPNGGRGSSGQLPGLAADPSRPRVDAVPQHTPTGAVPLGRDASSRDVAAPPRADVRRPTPPEPAPLSEATPPPRANWSAEVLKADASRARPSAEIMSYGASPRPAKPAQDAEASAVSRSIGEMTRVAPLAPEADAARKQAIALASSIAKAKSLETPAAKTQEPARARDAFGKPEEDTKRRQQKTARVRGPDGSGGYTPPPPPMALPQDAPVKPVKPPSGLKKSFDAFATHFEEVNYLRKVLYLASPFLVLIAAYILFGPEPPPPQDPMAAPPVVAPSTPLPQAAGSANDMDASPVVQMARPDSAERPAESDIEAPAADAGAPTKGTKPGKNEKKVLTPERLAADAYAAGQLDLAIERYRKLVEESAGQPRWIALSEVLHILESKKASGRQETLEQAPPTKSVR